MKYEIMHKYLKQIALKPEPYAYYTAADLWTDPYISKKMLALHLSQDSEAASRPKDFVKRSVSWILQQFQFNEKLKVCDFGCGPGLYTTPFAETGAEVTGLDFSERSIDYAQKVAHEKKLSIDYLNVDYLTFTTDKKFDLITMIYCDFSALSDQQRKLLLQSFYEKCEVGGHILLDIYSLQHYKQKLEGLAFNQSSDDNLWTNFWSAEPYFVFTASHKYPEKNLLLDKYVIVEENSSKEIYNWIKCYDLRSITEELV